VNVSTDGIAMTNTPFTWNSRDDLFYSKKSSSVFEKISRRYGFTIPELEQEYKIRTLILNELMNKKITGFKEVQSLIHQYYKDPKGVLSYLGISGPAV